MISEKISEIISIQFMIFPYTKIVKLEVFDLKNQRGVGAVKEIIIQKKDFKISGIILENSFLDRGIKIVNSTDIVDISPEGVVINDSDSISSPKENVRLAEAIKDGLYGIGQKVVTKDGKSLGRVNDLFVSTETLMISKIFIKNIFSERVIPSSAIVEIKGKKIIVKNNFETVRVSVPEISASVV
ncbi:MAG: PRC-barrel domain-containing protein [Patescibacteria group bacterium]